MREPFPRHQPESRKQRLCRRLVVRHLPLLALPAGAVPNEKITWGKLGEKTPKFIVESDASIVAPLMFAYVLEW